jgi:GNAT superfamily N-acetyltransferase
MDRLKPLWNELYRHQSEHGMLLHLPDGAFEAWLNSINPFLGRFAAVVVAEEGNDLVAFVAGRIRTLPPYFGSSNVGTISEVFVRESHRRAGIARRLLDLGIEWFATQEITRVELQVVAGNRAGIEFYRRLGWREELVQFVWDSPRR